MLDNSFKFEMLKKLIKIGERQFALKGVMSVEDAKRAVDIGVLQLCYQIMEVGN